MLGLGLLGLPGCSSDDKASATHDETGKEGGGTPAETLYHRLGEKAGIETVVSDFVTRVVGDPKINGYFLNSSVDAEHLKSCLVDQISEATGGTEKYGCRDMKSAHEGLGISQQDFDDLVQHLTDALAAADVKQEDIDTIVSVLGPMSKDIVEDATNDSSIYQRVGRKPAIQAVVGLFHENIAADARINAFFAKTDAERLGTCLVRQVCMATGGPCKYGEEIPDAEPGVKSACRDMKTTHKDIGIAKADFDALVEDLVAALTKAGVTEADRGAIGSALLPLCPDIVEKGTCE